MLSLKNIVCMWDKHKYLAWKFNSVLSTQSKVCWKPVIGTDVRNLSTFWKTIDTFSIPPRQKHRNGEPTDCGWDPMNTRLLLTHTTCLQQLCSAMTLSYFRLITAFSVTFQLLLLNLCLLGIFGFQAPTS